MAGKTRKELEQKLGHIAFQIGKQQQVMQREQKKLQNLQVQANEIATEIEKLDGERTDT